MHATTYRQARGHRVVRAIARERAAGYTADDRLAAAVDQVVATDLDGLDDAAVRARLRQVQHAIDRLSGFRTKAAGVLEARALAAAGPGRERTALRGVRDDLVDQLRLTPSQAKQAGQTGRRLADTPAAQAAMTDGDLPADHARVLADTLHGLPPAVRARLEPPLLEAARTEDATTFGRTCRRALAAADAAAADRAQDARNARRSLRVTDTPDGMVALHGYGSGLDGEIVQTALHAFRRPDAPGEHRRPDQATWDALVQVCTTALDAGTAPANRRVRPHLLITIPETLITDRHHADGDGGCDGDGRDGRDRGDGGDGRDGDGRGGGGAVAEGAWSGPLTWPQIRPLLADADVSRLLVDAAGLPLEASESVRTVPAGLWKALQIRDRTCIADGCTIPAAWCQIMHLDVPYRLGGRLTLDTAAPGCSHHHKLYDRHGWTITWIDGRPILHHPDRPPRAGPDP